MRARCAGVSVTLTACGGAEFGFWSQPAINSRLPSATIFFSSTIFGILIGKVGAMPPTAAERLEQGGRIGEAGGLCRKQGDFRSLIGLLCVQRRERIGVAIPQLAVRDFQGGLCGRIGGGRGLYRRGILLQGNQGVGDILESAEQGGAVLRRRGVEGGARRAFLMSQRAAVEDGRREIGGHGPEFGAGLKEP